jgi:hypothetical protein
LGVRAQGGRLSLSGGSDGWPLEIAVPVGWRHDRRFPGLAGLAELDDDLVVDGEVACCDESGLARFECLGGWRGGSGTGTVRFYPFDLLRLDGAST